MQDILKGKMWKYGDDVNTDEIVPARYLNTSNHEELAKYCMEDIDADFVKKIKKGDVIGAGNNFGCGSSREHAPISIKAVGVSCVIAKSFARIFYRNCINIGLPILECPEFINESKDGDEIVVDLTKGEITNKSNNKIYKSQLFPDEIKKIISAGGLMNSVKEEVEKQEERSKDLER